MLLATGELNRELGGVPVMPEINLEVALQPRMIQFSIAPAYQPSRTPEDRNRRSIYAYRVRGQADPFMEVMNLPNPNDSCELRDTAAVSPQAFTLLNSDVMSDRSIALATARAKGCQDIARADWPSISIGARSQADRRRTPIHARVCDRNDRVSQHTTSRNRRPIRRKSSRSLVEEFSGDTFEFDEMLPVFEDYVPDAKPATVSAETRAMADMCLLLLNANEFVYVY